MLFTESDPSEKPVKCRAKHCVDELRKVFDDPLQSRVFIASHSDHVVLKVEDAASVAVEDPPNRVSDALPFYRIELILIHLDVVAVQLI